MPTFIKKNGQLVPIGGDGVGVPTGGQTGQTLMKASTSNFDMKWGAVDALPEGGDDGDVLTRSGTEGVDWFPPQGADAENTPFDGSDASVLESALNVQVALMLADAELVSLNSEIASLGGSFVGVKSIVHDYGASQSDSPSVLHGKIQQALNECAGEFRVFIPAGVWVINSSLRIPSGTYLYGVGMERTIIRMANNTGDRHPVLWSGGVGDKRVDIVIEDLTADYNFRGRGSESTGVLGVAAGTAVTMIYTERAYIRRVKAYDAIKHGFDVAGSHYGRSGTVGDHITVTERSRHVYFSECYADGYGDDGFTSHTCNDVVFSNCISKNATGAWSSSNSNGFEVDDDTDGAMVINCYAENTHRALDIKGHGDAKAARRVKVVNFEAYDNTAAFDFRHTSIGESSTTAHDIQVINLRGERFRASDKGGNPSASYPGRVHSYQRVQMTNVTFVNGGSEFLVGSGSRSVIRVNNGARHLQFQNFFLSGFSSWDQGLWITGSAGTGRFDVEHFTADSEPDILIRDTHGSKTQDRRYVPGWNRIQWGSRELSSGLGDEIFTIRDDIGGDNLPGLRSTATNAMETTDDPNMVISGSSNFMRSTSSERVKANIEPVEPEYYSRVLDLEPIWYRSKTALDRKDWSHYGLSAERTAEVDPRLVQWVHKDGPSAAGEYDDEPIPDDLLVPGGVQYGRIGVLLIPVVREQRDRIEELERQVKELARSIEEANS